MAVATAATSGRLHRAVRRVRAPVASTAAAVVSMSTTNSVPTGFLSAWLRMPTSYDIRSVAPIRGRPRT